MTVSPGRLVDRLSSIATRPERLVVGLMSGTSFDGIDAALVRVSGHGEDLEAELVRFNCFPFGDHLRCRIGAASLVAAPDIARLDFDLGDAFADAALAVIEGAGLSPSDVDLIGSHGQTIWHDPPRGPSGAPGSAGGATLQIGQPDVIAARTGIVTVADFRTADVAAGGSGAPLIPYIDWLLFRDAREERLLLNVGGIANVTYVVEDIDRVVAFDTGPGNALIDEIARCATGGAESMDRDGARALRGDASEEAVARFLGHPYFKKPPPKSTGKETFGPQAARELARGMFGGRGVEDLDAREVDDLLATATAITARSVADARGLLPAGSRISRVIVSGGGVRNEALMRMLGTLFAPIPVEGLVEYGMDPDAKEAVGFAILANEALMGRPANVPAATGASRPVVLGKVSIGI
jgi:anhydro-N-acetylmuramic acid kinase